MVKPYDVLFGFDEIESTPKIIKGSFLEISHYSETMQARRYGLIMDGPIGVCDGYLKEVDDNYLEIVFPGTNYGTVKFTLNDDNTIEWDVITNG